jgi:hypothetical protein
MAVHVPTGQWNRQNEHFLNRRDSCFGTWWHLPGARSGPRTTKAPTCGAFARCAEEDSNLHPVIPEQALNLARLRGRHGGRCPDAPGRLRASPLDAPNRRKRRGAAEGRLAPPRGRRSASTTSRGAMAPRRSLPCAAPNVSQHHRYDRSRTSPALPLPSANRHLGRPRRDGCLGTTTERPPARDRLPPRSCIRRRLSHKPVRKSVRQSVVGQRVSRLRSWLSLVGRGPR